MQLSDAVIVTIFVNPAQFGPDEDYQRYPRPLDADLDVCRDAGVVGVFNPSVEEIYPPGIPAAAVNVPQVAAELESASRPGHFEGVCRVVLKLLNIVGPQFACFGLKDYQQLCVIHAMVTDLNLPIEIVPCPTVREPDGLALSSRNQYLDSEQRQHALALYKSLLEARMLVQTAGETDPEAVERAMQQTMTAHGIDVDYAAIRHPTTLAQLDSVDPCLTGGLVALVAGRLRNVRLIDSMLLTGRELTENRPV